MIFNINNNINNKIIISIKLFQLKNIEENIYLNIKKYIKIH